MDNILEEALKFDFSSMYTTDNVDDAVNLFIEYTQKIIVIILCTKNYRKTKV